MIQEFELRKKIVEQFPDLAELLATQPISSVLIGEALRQQTRRPKSWNNGTWSMIGSQEGADLYREWAKASLLARYLESSLTPVGYSLNQDPAYQPDMQGLLFLFG